MFLVVKNIYIFSYFPFPTPVFNRPGILENYINIFNNYFIIDF